MATTGLISLKEDSQHFSLYFQDLGWMAADLVQYLEDLLLATNRQTAILKLLGMTLQITPTPPARSTDHWVFIDLDQRELETNSDLIRLAVNQQTPPPESPYSQLALRRIYSTLDRYDFTVTFAV